jgi:hypothetical protein
MHLTVLWNTTTETAPRGSSSFFDVLKVGSMFINCGLRKLLHVDLFIALLLLHVLRYIYHHIQNYLSKSFSFLGTRCFCEKPPTWEAMSFETRKMCSYIITVQTLLLNYIIHTRRPLHTYIAKEIRIYRINCKKLQNLFAMLSKMIMYSA